MEAWRNELYQTCPVMAAESLVLMHSAKNSEWKNHQYIKKEKKNGKGVYYYPDSYEGGRHLKDGDGSGGGEMEDWEKKIHEHIDSIVKQHPELFDSPDKIYANIMNPNNAEAFKNTLKALTGMDNLPADKLDSMRKQIASYYGKGSSDSGSAGSGKAGSGKKASSGKKSSKGSTGYSEYSKDDSDFDDKNYSDKNHVKNTDFYSFVNDNGETVILEEDMKWKLPKGKKMDASLERRLQAATKTIEQKRKSGQKVTNDDFVKTVTKAVMTESASDRNRGKR